MEFKKSSSILHDSEKSRSVDVFDDALSDSQSERLGLQNPSLFFAGLKNLQQAARDGQVEIVRQHINAIGKHKKNLNRKDENQTTALHYAVRYNHFNIVKSLLESGASVNMQGEYGATALHYATGYVANPSKDCTDATSWTPSNSPLPKLKSTKFLKQLIKTNQFTAKKALVAKRKYFSGKRKRFVDSRGCVILPQQKTIANCLLEQLNERNTVHDSLENLPNFTPEHQVEKNFFCKESFRYEYVLANTKVRLEKHIVIIDKLDELDTSKMKLIDALIIPKIQNVSSPDVDELTLSLQLQQCTSWPNLIDSQFSNPEGHCSHDNKKATIANRKQLSKVSKNLDIYFESIYPADSILTYLLDQDANFNARDFYGSTPLHYATLKGNVAAALQLLSQKKIDIEAADRTQMTALHAAAKTDSYIICKLLVASGANIRCFDENHMTPLHFAAIKGNLAIVDLLLSHGEEQGGYVFVAKMIMDQDIDGQTVVHFAIQYGHFDIVKYCIGKGANVNFVKNNLITPLHMACTSGEFNIVKGLVDSEADIEAKNAFGETPLHYAAHFDWVNIVKFLLAKGAEINCQDEKKQTPLMMSVRKNNVRTAKLLLRERAEVLAKGSAGKTCLHLVAEEGCVDILMVLKEHDKVKNLLEEFDKNENRPLHVAAMKGNANIVEMLLDMGACIDIKNDNNRTPLHLAAKNGHYVIVEMLLTQGTSFVDNEDSSSNTPLHLAALEGHVKVVEILLQYGAAIDTRLINAVEKSLHE